MSKGGKRRRGGRSIERARIDQLRGGLVLAKIENGHCTVVTVNRE